MPSRACEERAQQRAAYIHYKNLHNVKPSIDNADPRPTQRSRAKAAWLENERNARIMRENNLLLARLQKIIERKPGQQTPLHLRTAANLMPIRPGKSDSMRRAEQDKIQHENEALLRRLQYLKPTYDSRKMEEHARNHRLWSSHIRQRPSNPFLNLPSVHSPPPLRPPSRPRPKTTGSLALMRPKTTSFVPAPMQSLISTDTRSRRIGATGGGDGRPRTSAEARLRGHDFHRPGSSVSPSRLRPGGNVASRPSTALEPSIRPGSSAQSQRPDWSTQGQRPDSKQGLRLGQGVVARPAQPARLGSATLRPGTSSSRPGSATNPPKATSFSATAWFSESASLGSSFALSPVPEPSRRLPRERLVEGARPRVESGPAEEIVEDDSLNVHGAEAHFPGSTPPEDIDDASSDGSHDG